MALIDNLKISKGTHQKVIMFHWTGENLNYNSKVENATDFLFLFLVLTLNYFEIGYKYFRRVKLTLKLLRMTDTVILLSPQIMNGMFKCLIT